MNEVQPIMFHSGIWVQGFLKLAGKLACYLKYKLIDFAKE